MWAMTFNPNANISSGNVRRRSGGGGIGTGGLMLGGGGAGTLIIALILMFTGVLDPSALLSGGGMQTGPVNEQALDCSTGQDANERDECLVQGTIESADDLWQQTAPRNGFQWEEPDAIVFEGSVTTACGQASAAVGPFYCPADKTIYIDVSFYEELSSRFGSSGGNLAKEYVVAHEYGHHIQNLDRTMESIDRRQTGPQSDQVRLELQADCYAGMWARHASTTKDANGNTFLQPLTEQDVRDGLSAASSVGDDHIQGEVAGGRVQPDTWTHGSSEQRMKWFITGYNEGTYKACDTFSVDRV